MLAPSPSALKHLLDLLLEAKHRGQQSPQGNKLYEILVSTCLGGFSAYKAAEHGR